jgi:hypothetical protein
LSLFRQRHQVLALHLHAIGRHAPNLAALDFVPGRETHFASACRGEHKPVERELGVEFGGDRGKRNEKPRHFR